MSDGVCDLFAQRWLVLGHPVSFPNDASFPN
jgi:hypothetical protein